MCKQQTVYSPHTITKHDDMWWQASTIAADSKDQLLGVALNDCFVVY